MLIDPKDESGYIYFGVHFKDSIPVLEAIAEQFNLTTVAEVIEFLINKSAYELAHFGQPSRINSWQFNHCQRPKFWLGDRVQLNNREGTIYGMQRRDDTTPYLQAGIKAQTGWIYQIKFDGKYGYQSVHENQLTLIQK